MQTLGAGHIEIGFVDGGHLHQRRKRSQDVMNSFRALTIAIGMSMNEDGMRTDLCCRAQRHGRMHPEFAGFVGSS
jgi:hypothetical protein